MQADIMGKTHKETIHILATLFDPLLTRHSLSGDLRAKEGKGKRKERQNERTKERKNEGQANPEGKKKIFKERQERAGWSERAWI